MATLKQANFRELNAELEAILEAMQAGELDVDAAIKHYERGLAITKELTAYLKQAENKITKVG